MGDTESIEHAIGADMSIPSYTWPDEAQRFLCSQSHRPTRVGRSQLHFTPRTPFLAGPSALIHHDQSASPKHARQKQASSSLSRSPSRAVGLDVPSYSIVGFFLPFKPPQIRCPRLHRTAAAPWRHRWAGAEQLASIPPIQLSPSPIPLLHPVSFGIYTAHIVNLPPTEAPPPPHHLTAEPPASRPHFSSLRQSSCLT